MLCLFFLLKYHFTKAKYGETHYLSHAEGNDLDSIISGNKVTVVAFKSDDDPLSFMNYAIYKYNSSVRFVFSGAKDGMRYGYKELPRVVIFRNNSNKRIDSFALDDISLSQEIENALCNGVKVVRNAEEARLLFETHDFVFGTNEIEPIKLQDKGDVFYSIPQALLDEMNINLSKGYYVYKKNTRDIIPLKKGDDYAKIIKTNVKDINEIDYKSKPFFAGYILNTKNAEENEIEFKIMNKIADKFDNFNIAPIIGNKGQIIKQIGRFTNFNLPIFCVISTKDEKRWGIIDNKLIHDDEYIINFLEKIEKGEEPETLFSEEIIESNPLQLVGKNFNEMLNGNIDSVIYFYNKRTKQEIKEMATIEISSKIYSSNPVKFYTFNISANDIPKEFHLEMQVPVTVLINSATKNVNYYEGPYDIYGFVEWVSYFSSTQFPIPKYNLKRAKRTARAKIHKELKKLNEEL